MGRQIINLPGCLGRTHVLGHSSQNYGDSR
jgi:hypothetical protein